jgi:hypothetical protein
VRVDSTKTKREIATDLLRDLFRDRTRIEIAEAVKRGAALGVSRRTLLRAGSELGVREVHNGPFPAFWQLDG